MCGIVAYIGEKDALPVLLNGLERLEYRGYDSLGVFLLNDKESNLFKTTRRVKEFKKITKGKKIVARLGIAHTRWATHGKPTKINAHPHTGCNKEFYIVHNGIIENYEKLKKELESQGHIFKSQTDSEVLAHLIEEEFKKYHNFEAAFKSAVLKVEGAYALVAVYKNDPEKILTARKSSPIVIGVGKNEYIVASDISAVLKYTNEVIYLSDNELAVCERGSLRISNFKDEVIGRKSKKVDISLEQAEKGNFETFMKKEIFDIPEVIKNALRGRLLEEKGDVKLGGLDEIKDKIKSIEKISIIACGTSYYAGLLAKYWFSDIAKIKTEVEIASEFKSKNILLDKKTLVIAISQSGETADTLEALKKVKKSGVVTLGVVNVVGSQIAKEADAGIYNHAGAEISVASTKAFVSQVIVIFLLVLFFAKKNNTLTIKERKKMIKALRRLYAKAGQVLGQQKKIKKIAEKYSKYKNFIFLGRKYNFPIALEGALKLKEISYIHAEAYAGGELKHGPLALIDKNFPTFCIATKGSVYDKMISNIEEIKARSGKIVCIAMVGDKKIEKLSDDIIFIPKVSETLSPVLSVITTQLFAYFVARSLKKDIDKPRNLAKSVTVE